ncbi:MAG: response regulator [Truepera sp.]|nr:response regulator [Truepera sp.]
MAHSTVNNPKGYSEQQALPCGLTVLHIDDDPLALELVQDQLVWQQVRVVSASRASDALRHLTAGPRPDLVLCDIMMPGQDGYGLHEDIRLHPAWRHIPFIYLTALDGDSYYRQGMNHGADGYLSKPFTAHELRQEMLHVLRRVAELRQTDVAITLLGGQSVRLGNTLLPPPDRGTEQLLYYLLVQPATPYGWLAERDQAISDLWEEVSAGGFRSVLSRLRRWLDGWATVESGATLCLTLAPGVSCDLHALEHALEKSCHSERLRRLYQGPLLPEYHQEWAATRREGLIVRLKQAFLAASQRSEPRDRALQLRYALEVDPLDQSLWQSYLQLLKQTGLSCEIALARKQLKHTFS